MPRLFFAVFFLILYGSLYPWRFTQTPDGVETALELLTGGAGPVLYRDVLVNIAIYVPVGACAYLAFRTWRFGRLAATMAAVASGSALSVAVEILQIFEGSRRTSIYDVYANVAGSIAGTLLASGFSVVSKRLIRRAGARHADAGALALLVCFVAYLWYPFVPVLSTRFAALKLLRATAFHPLDFVSAAVAWLVAGFAIEASGVKRPAWVAAATVLLVPSQLVIAGRVPGIDDLAGAACGAFCYVALRRQQFGRGIAAAAALILLLFRGLLPLDVSRHANSFNWVPFGAMLEGSWQTTSRLLLEKLFFYGAAIWALCNAGIAPGRAVIATAAMLAFIELAQLWLPRTPEVTDPLLALLIGVGFAAFRSEAKRISSLSGTSVSSTR